MADELIDIFDQDMNLIGTAMKSQAHKEGLWHKCFHCWIISHGKVWLQLRGNEKSYFPNLLDISVAGHIQAGETAKDAIREAEEEIGLTIDPHKLNKLFTHTIIDDNNGINNREFCPTYLYETNKTLDDLKMQPEEVDGVLEIAPEEAIKLFENELSELKISGISRNLDNSNQKSTKIVRKSDFVPHGDEYYLKIFNTIKRYLERK